jgi:hypothetical protein
MDNIQRFIPGSKIAISGDGVLFPTVVVKDGNLEKLGEVTYCAFSGYHPEFLAGHVVTTKTIDGYYVHGAEVDDFFPATDGDVTVVPVTYENGRTWLYPAESPFGHSADLAISLANRIPKHGVPAVLCTGTVTGDEVGDVLLVDDKVKLVLSTSLPLIGGVASASFDSHLHVMRTVEQSLDYVSHHFVDSEVVCHDRAWVNHACANSRIMPGRYLDYQTQTVAPQQVPRSSTFEAYDD